MTNTVCLCGHTHYTTCTHCGCTTHETECDVCAGHGCADCND